MRLLLHFARFGPYHHARLRAAHEQLEPLGWEVIGLETAGTDATYAWDKAGVGPNGPQVLTVFPGRVYEEITAAEYRATLLPLLDSLAPDAMAIAGWGTTDALMCLSWCRKHDIPRIVMSETRAADGKRVWWKELVKRYFISRFDAGLVGAKSHRDYLVKLGMKPERIAFGYNVVDNRYFAKKTQDTRLEDTRGEDGGREAGDRGQESRDSGEADRLGALAFVASAEQAGADQGPRSPYPVGAGKHQAPPFFLASNRFIERKNLARLIDAYERYVKNSPWSMVRGPLSVEHEAGAVSVVGSAWSEDSEDSAAQWHAQGQRTTDKGPRTSDIWPLVLLGDGELKPALIAQCQRLGLLVIESAPWEADLTPDSCLSAIARKATAGPLTPAPNRPVVWMPGFRQIEDLPNFYARAGAFIHPALEEPWGLVINEAMASGLPILSGDNVGAAEELVDDGVNGWKFDAGSVEEMAGALLRIATLGADALAAMGESSRRLLEARCPTRAFGEGLSKVLGGRG